MSILNAADARTADFTVVKKGGYDVDEIELFREDVCETIVAANEQIKDLSDQLNSALERIPALEAEAKDAQALAASARAEAEASRGGLDLEQEANRAALEEAAAGLAAAQDAMIRMQAELESLRQASGVSEAVELLSAAQHTAAETIASALAHAEQIKDAAEAYEVDTRADADEYARSAHAVADSEIADLKSQASALREGEAAYRSRVASVLRSALEFVEGSVASDAAPVVDGASMEGMFELNEAIEEAEVTETAAEASVIDEHAPVVEDVIEAVEESYGHEEFSGEPGHEENHWG